MRAYVGVDWSASEIICSTATDSEEPRRIKGAGRNFEAVKELLDRVRTRHPDVEEIHVFIEAGASGWVEMLHHAGAIVHVADARQAKAFAESWRSSGAKDDGGDSLMMTWFARERCDQLASYEPPSALNTTLTELASLEEMKSKQCTAEKQRLRAYLREHFPELEAELSDLSRGWVFRLLRHIPTAYHAAEFTRRDFEDLMQGSRARATTLEQVWTTLQAAQAPWLTEEFATIYAFKIKLMVDELERLARQLEQISDKLDAATRELPERSLLESVGGIAAKMANRLITLVFDGERLPENRDEASIRLGASPVFRGSGKTRDGRPKGYVMMRRSAGSRAMATTYLLGRLASQQLAWAKARYAYDKGRGKSSAQSYRNIARSLLRILTAMLKSGEPYDDARYVAQLKLNGVVWAMDL